MAKILEVNSVMLALFGVSLFGAAKYFLARLSKIFEKEKQERKVMDDAIKAILHNKIYKNGMNYLERKCITLDELDDIEKLYKPYAEMGGNSTAKIIIENVRNLEIKKSEIPRIRENEVDK